MAKYLSQKSLDKACAWSESHPNEALCQAFEEVCCSLGCLIAAYEHLLNVKGYQGPSLNYLKLEWDLICLRDKLGRQVLKDRKLQLPKEEAASKAYAEEWLRKVEQGVKVGDGSA